MLIICITPSAESLSKVIVLPLILHIVNKFSKNSHVPCNNYQNFNLIYGRSPSSTVISKIEFRTYWTVYNLKYGL